MSDYEDEEWDDDDFGEYGGYTKDRAEERDTKMEKKGEKVQITFNAEQFANDVVNDVVNTVKENLKREVMEELKQEVITDKLRETVRREANAVVKKLIDDFMQNEKITIGGNGFYDSTPRQEFTLAEYSKKCIGDVIKSGKFETVTEKASAFRSARTREYSFEEYIREELSIGDDVKNYIDDFVAGVRNDVNKRIKDTFDESMKNALSSSLLQMLTANASYKKISNEIAQIANKEDE